MTCTAVILVTWNQRADALECLDSLARTRESEKYVILVDNGSTDGTVEAVRRLHPEATLLEAGGNIGFAAANNLGIRLALERGSPFIFLLNTDTVVGEGILDALLGAMASEPRLGIAGPRMYFYHEPRRVWYAGGATDIATGFSTHWRYGEVDPEKDGDSCPPPGRSRAAGDVTASGIHARPGPIVPCSFVTGAGMFIRSEVFRVVGLLGEEFFHTAEDADFCHRALEDGFLIAHVPRARMWHKVRSSTGGPVRSNPLYVYYEFRNKILIAGKHASIKARVLGLPRSLYHLARAEWTLLRDERNPAAALAVLRGIADGFRGRAGRRNATPPD